MSSRTSALRASLYVRGTVPRAHTAPKACPIHAQVSDASIIAADAPARALLPLLAAAVTAAAAVLAPLCCARTEARRRPPGSGPELSDPRSNKKEVADGAAGAAGHGASSGDARGPPRGGLECDARGPPAGWAPRGWALWQISFGGEAVLMMELPRRHATPFKGQPVRTHYSGGIRAIRPLRSRFRAGARGRHSIGPGGRLRLLACIDAHRAARPIKLIPRPPNAGMENSRVLPPPNHADGAKSSMKSTRPSSTS